MSEAPGRGGFPATHHSAVHRTRSSDPEERRRGLEAVASVYWKPVYKYLRLRHGLEPPDAEDMTQSFFSEAIARESFARYEPARARFRTYLRTCLDGHVANQRKAAARLKRGGDARRVPLDFARAEAELALQASQRSADPEELFRREWLRRVFELAVAKLAARTQAEGKQERYAVFERYDLAEPDERPSYAELAAELGIPATQVTNHLAWARRELRRLLLAELQAVCASEAEYRMEAQALLAPRRPA